MRNPGKQVFKKHKLLFIGTDGATVPEVKKVDDQKPEVKQEVKVEGSAEDSEPRAPSPPLKTVVKDELLELQRENKRLHNLVTDLHKRHHQQTLQVGL